MWSGANMNCKQTLICMLLANIEEGLLADFTHDTLCQEVLIAGLAVYALHLRLHVFCWLQHFLHFGRHSLITIAAGFWHCDGEYLRVTKCLNQLCAFPLLTCRGLKEPVCWCRMPFLSWFSKSTLQCAKLEGICAYKACISCIVLK